MGNVRCHIHPCTLCGAENNEWPGDLCDGCVFLRSQARVMQIMNVMNMHGISDLRVNAGDLAEIWDYPPDTTWVSMIENEIHTGQGL